MNIPNFFVGQFVDKNGYLTPFYQNLFQQLFTQMQANLSNNGIGLPLQDSATIALLNTTASTGKMLYDSDTDEAKVNIAGTFRVIQVV